MSPFSLAKNFQQSYIEGGGQFYSFCNKTFASWDFCITDGKTARIRSQNFFNDIEVKIYTQYEWSIVIVDYQGNYISKVVQENLKTIARGSL